MQGTVPVRVARAPKRRWPRRRHIVVGLALALLVAASSIVILGWLRPFGSGPRKPSPEIVKLASSYRYRETLTDAFDAQSWSPNGRYLATYSISTRGILAHDLGRQKSPAWSVPVETFGSFQSIWMPGNAVWSPDSRLLAVGAALSSVPYTITLIYAEEGTVRNTIHVPGPPEVTGSSTGPDQTPPAQASHMLLGWTDNGRSLVTLAFVRRQEDSDLNPGHSLFEPTPQPTVTPVIPSYTVYCYVHDSATGEMVRSTQIYSSTSSYLPFYGLALSPGGDTLAFATTGGTSPSAGSTSQVNLDLWDLRTGRLKHSTHGVGDKAIEPFLPGVLDQFLAWAPDGATLYVASDVTVKVIEAATGRIVRTLPDVVPPTGTPTPPAPRPPTPWPGGLFPPPIPSVPGAVSTAGAGGAAQPKMPLIALPDIFGWLFPQRSPGVSPTPTPDPRRYYPILSIGLSPSGDRLAVVDYPAIRVWETASGKLRMLTSMPGVIPWSLSASMYNHSHARLTWLAEGRLLASHFSDYGPGIWLIDPETGAHLRQLSEHPQYATWSPATNMLAIGDRTRMEIWAGDDPLGPAASSTGSSVP